LNLLDTFDEVILMQAGRVVDAGSVVDLAIRSPLFRDLLAAQGAGQLANPPGGDARRAEAGRAGAGRIDAGRPEAGGADSRRTPNA